MYECLYAQLGEVLLEVIAALAPHGEEMEDMAQPRMYAGHLNEGIGDVADVSAGNLPTTVVIGIQTGEFDAEHGCLQLVEAAIDTLILIDVLLA